MLDETILQRLAQDITPGDDQRSRLRMRIQQRINPLQKSVDLTQPSLVFRKSMKDRVLLALQGSPVGDSMRELAKSVSLSGERVLSLREMILGRLALRAEPSLVHSSVKWAASFALFLLIIRAMPLVFLAPTTQAGIGVQLIPNGDDVSVFVGGVWRSVISPEVVGGPMMIRTGQSQVTIILNDDGVIRLGSDTTFKLHDIGDRPQFVSAGPTATLVRGQIWVLGLLPPVVESILIETTRGQVEINSGSVSITEDNKSTTVAVYDRGVTFRDEEQTSFIVSGEKGMISDRTPTLSILSMPTRAFGSPLVSQNLEQDAVHRNEIAKLQKERRERMAGILPTSILYPAKRIAERVDVLFTLTHDGRTEKLIAQADTRLSEALALIHDGQNTEASVPLSEYRDSLVAMASGTGDNLVKYLIKRQIADASATISPTTSSGKIQLVSLAVLEISASVPDTALQSKDIEGYVLVNKLTQINHALSVDKNLTGALLAYSDVSPYIKELLSENGTHPLLQKEARSLLVSTASLLKGAKNADQNKILVAVEQDLSQYLPPEQESVLVTEAKLNAVIQKILQRIFIFKSPLSRYNQLMQEMLELRGNQNRGTLLRRLYSALPENGLGGYVLTEIKNFGDELNGR
ncbi:hypothetical protein EXS65_00355 [Candidatus Peribacteria bacterium]|nr:hypothetical protein [Candidatus Peribacteria bacterium]